MKIAYRLFIGATLAVLAYGMATAHMRSDPWLIIGPFAVLAVVGGIRYRGEPE